MKKKNVLDQHDYRYLDFYTPSSLKKEFADGLVAPLGTHYPDSKQSSLCSYSLMLNRKAPNTNYLYTVSCLT